MTPQLARRIVTRAFLRAANHVASAVLLATGLLLSAEEAGGHVRRHDALRGGALAGSAAEGRGWPALIPAILAMLALESWLLVRAHRAVRALHLGR
jgi:hypothetical protein